MPVKNILRVLKKTCTCTGMIDTYRLCRFRLFRSGAVFWLFRLVLIPLVLLPATVFKPVFAAGLPSLQEALSVDVAYAADAQERIAVLWLTPEKGAYAYARGNAKPVRVTVHGPNGAPVPTATVLYLPGTEREDFFEPGKRIPVYEDRFPVFIRLQATQEIPDKLTAQLSLLLCSPTRCTPVERAVTLDFPAEAAPLSTQPWKTLLARAEPASEAPLTAIPRESTPAGNLPRVAEEMYPEQQLAPASPWRQAVSLPSFTPRYAHADLEPLSFGPALLLGLLAGLILNVMPCVLPVLTIKMTALLQAASGTTGRFREHNLLFAAGILTWFLVLALFAGGAGMAWGSLFQRPGVVYGLLILIFLLGLSLFDVFTLPLLDFKLGYGGSPRLQAYLSGLTATLLATPCSGPLLGGVLGWAVLQPLPVLILIFIATGLGMALPYLALALRPDAARLLPRPGPWTGVLERLIGFLLMGTALYLLSILPESLRLSALTALLFCGLAAWIWGRWGSPAASSRRRSTAAAAALLLAVGAVIWSLQPAPPPAAWQAFTPQAFRAVWGKEPLLLEFTADWCPTCKVLERTTLTPERLNALRKRYGLTLMRVDITRPDPEAEALLRALGSVSIPLTALFSSGPDAASPLVLRDIYTAAQLETAVKELFAKESPRVAQP